MPFLFTTNPLAFLTYCQSNDSVRIPRPSLFTDPPKMLVRVAAVAPVARIAARHGIDTALSHGQIYAGKNSYANMATKLYQNQRSALESLTFCQCRPCSVLTVGRVLQ